MFNLNLPFRFKLKLFDNTNRPFLEVSSYVVGFVKRDKVACSVLSKFTISRKSTLVYILYYEPGR